MLRAADGPRGRLQLSRERLQLHSVEREARVPDVILARNLEMLMLGRRAMAALSPRPRLVYELLDIHRAMLGSGIHQVVTIPTKTKLATML